MRRFFILIVAVVLFTACQSNKAKYLYSEGFMYGTIYHVTYESPKGTPLDEGLVAAMKKLDQSLSTFNKQSTLAKINSNEQLQTDSLFDEVFEKSVLISNLTGGAFDPTVAPLVNAWGFGFKQKEQVTPALIDSLLKFSALNFIRVEKNTVVKSDARTMLDFSAIAKGYAVDLVARYLDAQGCKNYMVEIGGELVVKGKNPTGNPWRIGVNEPNEDEPAVTDEFQAILALSDRAMATSGNYRNFYEEGGKKYAHTIDPKTGYPVQHSLLSATVLANHCITADAFATAFMVMGWEKTLELCQSIDSIDVFLILDDGQGGYAVKTTPGFDRFLAK